jgi:hypothetical protein
MLETMSTQPFRTAAFEKTKIRGVVNAAREVCVLVIDSNTEVSDRLTFHEAALRQAAKIERSSRPFKTGVEPL